MRAQWRIFRCVGAPVRLDNANVVIDVMTNLTSVTILWESQCHPKSEWLV